MLKNKILPIIGGCLLATFLGVQTMAATAEVDGPFSPTTGLPTTVKVPHSQGHFVYYRVKCVNTSDEPAALEYRMEKMKRCRVNYCHVRDNGVETYTVPPHTEKFFTIYVPNCSHFTHRISQGKLDLKVKRLEQIFPGQP